MFNFADKNMLLKKNKILTRSQYLISFMKHKDISFFTLHICFYAASLAVISLGGLCPLRFWWKGKLVLIIIIVFNTININIINVITWTLGLVDSDPKALSMMVSATLAIVDFSTSEEPWNCNLAEKCSYGVDARTLFTRAGHVQAELLNWDCNSLSPN